MATRPTAPHLAEPELKHVTKATFAEWHKAISRGFQEEYHEELLEMDRRDFALDRAFGFKVGRRWVATCGDFGRRLVVPGGESVPAAAVTVVTVHPPYRRRGLLTQMMHHQLEQVAARGEALAVLWASESLIYGRFGYGPASSRLVLTGRTRRLEYLRSIEVPGSVDEVTREEYLRLAKPMHDAMVVDHPGAFVRDDSIWDFAVFDKPFARHGQTELRYVVHYDEAGDADGLATYRFKEEFDDFPASVVQVKEIWADDPGAHAGIWRYLLDLDLARSFRHWNAPVDEPLRHLVANARAVETKLTDNLYLRVTDVEAALRARRYAADVDLVIEVDDALLPQNSGRYRLVVDDGTASVSRVSTAPDVSVGILELGTIYLGGVPLSQLHRVGRVTEHTPGAVDAASAAFGWHRAPWCPDMF